MPTQKCKYYFNIIKMQISLNYFWLKCNSHPLCFIRIHFGPLIILKIFFYSFQLFKFKVYMILKKKKKSFKFIQLRSLYQILINVAFNCPIF